MCYTTQGRRFVRAVGTLITFSADVAMSISRVLATGDSHTGFWSGRPWYKGEGILKNIDLLPIRGATAYSLAKETSRTGAREKITSHLSNYPEKYDALVFCFGEIDCRSHVVKQAILQNRSILEIVKSIVDNYLSFVDHVNEKFSCPCILWGPIASSPPEKFNFNPEFPAVGTISERNYATMIMNTMLGERCQYRRSVAHISILDLMLDLQGNTVASLLFDGCHLSVDYISYGFRRLNQALLNMSLKPIFEPSRPVSDEPTIVNIAANRPIEQSSFLDSTKPAALRDVPDGNFAFQTNNSENPWIIIDLLSSFLLESIEAYDGVRACKESNLRLTVEASMDKKHWDMLYHNQNDEVDPFGRDNKLTVNLDGRRAFRFVRLSVAAKQYFRLQTVRVLAKVFSSPLASQGCATLPTGAE